MISEYAYTLTDVSTSYIDISDTSHDGDYQYYIFISTDSM